MSWYFLGGFSAYWIEPSGRLAEPLRMLLHVGMVRRALEGDVQGDLDLHLARLAHQPPEILQRAEFRMDRLVPAFRRADRPGAARLAGLAVRIVVLPFAKRAPDRDGWAAR